MEIVEILSLPPMQGIYLLMGTNLGDREQNLKEAKDLMSTSGIEVVKASSIYETAAWGIEDQPGFLNQVIEVKTRLSPHALLKVLLELELQMGRVRHQKWGERLIDLDILYYHNEAIDSEDLKVPHPGIPDRRFTLVPLVELAAEAIHPISEKTQEQLLNECKDELAVTRVG